MLIIFSILAVLAFVLISFYEDEYINDKMISRFTLVVKLIFIIILGAFFFFKIFTDVLPLFKPENNPDNFYYHKGKTQKIIIENNLDKEFEVTFFGLDESEHWLKTKPLNKFMYGNHLNIAQGKSISLYFNADSSENKMLYLVNKNAAQGDLWNAELIKIPVNTVKLYATDFSDKILKPKIHAMSLIKNIIFYFSILIIGLYLIKRNLRSKGYKKIILMAFISISIIIAAYEIYLNSMIYINY